MRSPSFLFFLSLCLLPTAAAAQTYGGVSSTPPGAVSSVPPRPVSDATLQQSADQVEGIFPPLERAGAMGGQIQEVWNRAVGSKGTIDFDLCERCVYKIRTREMMTTTIILPVDAVIVKADLGDPAGFQVDLRSPAMLAVRPAAWGIDTNLNVYTKSGRVYPFYVRAEGYNSRYVPDLLVRIVGHEDPGGLKLAVDAPVPAAPGVAGATLPVKPPPAPSSDFVRSLPFDVGDLHGWDGYRLWGDQSLRPAMVFRDRQFTYIQYDRETWDASELPAAYVVVDGIDELVNTRVSGSTYIVETTAPLISLKLGKKFLCLQYEGETP